MNHSPSDMDSAGHGMPPYEQSDAGNPYATHHQQQSAPDLDSAATQLKSSDARRSNRSAIGMLLALAALLVFGVFWMLFSEGSRNDSQPRPQKEETVSVPEAPKAPILPSAQSQVAQQAPPIPLALPQPKSQSGRTQPTESRSPTLLDRRIAAAEGAPPMGNSIDNAPAYPAGQAGNGMMPGITDMPDGLDQFKLPANSAYNAKPLPSVSNAQPLTHPTDLMLRGTYIRCVLETHIITDIPGFTSCVVTEPVYSFNGKHLLLPKGSKVFGSYSQEPNGPRVAVIWDRIVTPTGIDVNMASPGIDNLGGAGHPGYYNAHWGSRIGAALLISMLSDAFKYEAAKHGPTTNTIAASGSVVEQPFESNTAQTIQNLADQAVRRAANRPATVTINQGTVLTIYVAKDVDFTGVLARY